MMISLCMICANEEALIGKVLESAKDGFDELCLVRAIGAQVPDYTIAKAALWCKENGKVFRSGEYRNTIPGLPHVDDFGAARNLSFEIATGAGTSGSHRGNGVSTTDGTDKREPHWLLWLDCDDYLTPEGCQAIREITAREDARPTDVIFAPYSVEQDGGVIWRERLIRASAFREGRARWVGRVHEECVVTTDDTDGNGKDGKNGRNEGAALSRAQPRVDAAGVEVFHRGLKGKRRGSHERNLRLLELGLEEWIRGFFYYADALKNLAGGDAGKRAEAASYAKQALAVLRPYQVEERYVMFLQLAELELDRAVEWLVEAVKCQPHRREAFAYLVQKCLNVGDKSAAVSYFRMLDALPLPEPLPWTHQGVWYAWGRNYLYVRCLRACGNAKAEEFHRRYCEEPEYAAGVLQEREEKVTGGNGENRGGYTVDSFIACRANQERACT